VNASASQQLSIPYFVTGGPVIPSEQIAIPGLRKNLGTDGWAYGEVANGTPVDVTPTAGAPMYDFDWPGAAAYALSIVASSSTTQADLSISTPEFCVGQQVTFGTVWNLDPDYMPPNMLNPTYAWAYSGTFVNHSSQANSHSSVNWDVDVSLMNVATPYAYWVSGGNKNAYVNETLHFDNGQSATVSANGQFDMYRPSVAMVNSAYHGASMNVWRTPWNSAYFGDIGLGQVGGPSNMSYLVRVTSSDFSGAAKITQLCSINATALVNVNITGELDNGDPYTGATANIYENSNPQGTINELQLDDAPSDGWVSSFHDYSSFSDYVMFKPNGDGIYVTLGMVNWGMSFGASYPSLSISPNLVTGPSNPNGSDTFPTWEEIYSNQ